MDVQDDAGLLLAHHVPTAQGPRCPGPGCAGLVGQQPGVVEADEDDLHGRGAVAGLLGQGPGETLLRSDVMCRASPCAGCGSRPAGPMSRAPQRPPRGDSLTIPSSRAQRERHARPRLARSRRAVGCANGVATRRCPLLRRDCCESDGRRREEGTEEQKDKEGASVCERARARERGGARERGLRAHAWVCAYERGV
jgi:hypothetical protein